MGSVNAWDDCVYAQASRVHDGVSLGIGLASLAAAAGFRRRIFWVPFLASFLSGLMILVEKPERVILVLPGSLPHTAAFLRVFAAALAVEADLLPRVFQIRPNGEPEALPGDLP